MTNKISGMILKNIKSSFSNLMPQIIVINPVELVFVTKKGKKFYQSFLIDKKGKYQFLKAKWNFSIEDNDLLLQLSSDTVRYIEGIFVNSANLSSLNFELNGKTYLLKKLLVKSKDFCRATLCLLENGTLEKLSTFAKYSSDKDYFSTTLPSKMNLKKISEDWFTFNDQIFFRVNDYYNICDLLSRDVLNKIINLIQATFTESNVIGHDFIKLEYLLKVFKNNRNEMNENIGAYWLCLSEKNILIRENTLSEEIGDNIIMILFQMNRYFLTLETCLKLFLKADY